MTEKSIDAIIHDKDKIDSKDDTAISPNENFQSQYKDTIDRNLSKMNRSPVQIQTIL